MGSAVYDLQKLLLEDRGIKDRCQSNDELFGAEKEYDGDTAIHTLYLCKEKRGRWWRKITLRRPVVRITDVAEPNRWSDGRYNFNRYRGVEALKCELFLQDERLALIVRTFLDLLAKRLGYGRVEYIDMSDDPAAFYPGERPELPKAKVVNI